MSKQLSSTNNGLKLQTQSDHQETRTSKRESYTKKFTPKQSKTRACENRAAQTTKPNPHERHKAVTKEAIRQKRYSHNVDFGGH